MKFEAAVNRSHVAFDRRLRFRMPIALKVACRMPLPQHTAREMPFRNGTALGISNKWTGGQYCLLLTSAGIVGCGIYDLRVAAEFSQAVAIARGTPADPLIEPEDLLDAMIVDCTPLAKQYGILIGMTGRDAVERLLAASQMHAQSQTQQ